MKITGFEAKSLVALLHSKDNALLERTLTTIGNHATFEENQVNSFHIRCDKLHL